ncbi:MAG: hypothetical protein AAFQ98_21025, partial [Bacteroidota bacterium]
GGIRLHAALPMIFKPSHPAECGPAECGPTLRYFEQGIPVRDPTKQLINPLEPLPFGMQIPSLVNRGPFWVLSLLLVFRIMPGWAQGTGDPAQVMKARDHYYMVNENLDRYDKVEIDKGLTAFLRNGIPEKLVIQEGDSLQAEFYFSATRELLFGFVIDQGEQHRFYFGQHQKLPALGPLSELIRYQKMDGSFVAPSSRDFRKTGLQYGDLAWQAYQTTMVMLQLTEEERSRYQETVQYILEVKQASLVAVSRPAGSPTQTEDAEGSLVNRTQYAATPEGPVLKVVYATPMAEASAMNGTTQSVSYFGPEGNTVAHTLEQPMVFSGGPPSLPFSQSTGSLTRHTCYYYRSTSQEAPWVSLVTIRLDGYAVGLVEVSVEE